MSEALFRLHADLPREGPGDRESLDRAMQTAAIPADARMGDAGCGPGADVAGLHAAAPAGELVAVDRHAALVGAVAARCGGDARVTALVGDMADQAGPRDPVWSAGTLSLGPGADAALSAVVDDAAAEIALLRANRTRVGPALGVVRPA